MRELVSALIDASPVLCVPVDELELPAYYDTSQQTIFVKKGLSEEVLFVLWIMVKHGKMCPIRSLSREASVMERRLRWMLLLWRH